jgi:hypothetical protein
MSRIKKASRALNMTRSNGSGLKTKYQNVNSGFGLAGRLLPISYAERILSRFIGSHMIAKLT